MRTIVLMMVLLLGGCFDPTVDTSSISAYKASIEEIKQALPEGDRARFSSALKELVSEGMDLGALLALGSNPEAGLQLPQIKQLSGLTGDEVIAKGEAKIAARQAREREQALKEIAELEAKQALAEAAKLELAKFKVLSARFSRECNSKYCFRKEPRVLLRVENATGHAVSRAYFRGTVASPGRSVPWIQEEFNYQISGGLESGEKADWRLAPNSYSGDWGVETPADAIMTVEVVRLDGPDGEPLFDAAGLSSSQAERLQKLKQSYRM